MEEEGETPCFKNYRRPFEQGWSKAYVGTKHIKNKRTTLRTLFTVFHPGLMAVWVS
jgi:hypothetical protein